MPNYNRIINRKVIYESDDYVLVEEKYVTPSNENCIRLKRYEGKIYKFCDTFFDDSIKLPEKIKYYKNAYYKDGKVIHRPEPKKIPWSQPHQYKLMTLVNEDKKQYNDLINKFKSYFTEHYLLHLINEAKNNGLKFCEIDLYKDLDYFPRWENEIGNTIVNHLKKNGFTNIQFHYRMINPSKLEDMKLYTINKRQYSQSIFIYF